MNPFKTHIKYWFILCFLVTNIAVAQSKKQEELEERRQELKEEIKKINALLYQNKNKKQTQLSAIEDLNYKISVQKNLIKITNQQATLVAKEIINNEKKIVVLRENLKQLQTNYATLIKTKYKSKNEQSRVLFLLSSANFRQAFKRLQYYDQLANYQKEQGKSIQETTVKIQETNLKLIEQKKAKELLVAENKKVKNDLDKELKQQEEVMALIQKNLTKYTNQINTREAEARKIDKEIDRIIHATIASSNSKTSTSTKSSSKTYAMTPEDKLVATNFEATKGKLPWPVEKGIVTLRYGKQPSPIVKTIMIQSNGVRIATEKHAKVRAVFKGKVAAVIAIKNANPAVMIRHGNYFTVYKNLSKVLVKKGDVVSTKQTIGEVFTNPSTGKSVLSFSVLKNAKTENPASWIYKM